MMLEIWQVNIGKTKRIVYATEELENKIETGD